MNTAGKQQRPDTGIIKYHFIEIIGSHYSSVVIISVHLNQ